jgi:hypothetical protein
MDDPKEASATGDSDCLHCEINELVQERIEGGATNLADLAAMVVESLVELILLAPEGEQAKLLADALAHFGHTYLEKSGAIGAGSSATH